MVKNLEQNKIMIEKIGELDNNFDSGHDETEEEKAENNFELKKWSANVWSDIPEINKDFTMSNLSDIMFNSKVVNFIRNRIMIVKLLRNVFKYAGREYKDTNKIKITISEEMKQRIKFETIEFTNCRNLLLSEVYTILNLSKARGGLVLKAFLQGGMTEEEMEEVVGGEGNPALGEKTKRTLIDRMLGRNKAKKPEIQ